MLSGTEAAERIYESQNPSEINLIMVQIVKSFQPARRPQDMTVPKDVLHMVRGYVRAVVLSGLASVSYRKNNHFVKALCFHYMFPQHKEKFDLILRKLKSYGEFISTKDLITIIRGRSFGSGRYYHLSADDCFENVIVDAFHVCTSNSVPLTVFAPTGFIGRAPSEPTQFFENAEYTATLPLASWGELKDLSDRGGEVGSHTRSHRRLSAFDSIPAEIRSEIVESRSDLRSQLGKECSAFAWPFGLVNSIGPRAKKLIEEAGYSVAFSGTRGTITSATDRFCIPRHHFEPHWPIEHSLYFATRFDNT